MSRYRFLPLSWRYRTTLWGLRHRFSKTQKKTTQTHIKQPASAPGTVVQGRVTWTIVWTQGWNIIPSSGLPFHLRVRRTHPRARPTTHSLCPAWQKTEQDLSPSFVCSFSRERARLVFQSPPDGSENRGGQRSLATEPSELWLRRMEAGWMFKDGFYLDCAQWGK